jgi:hypothetical protein
LNSVKDGHGEEEEEEEEEAQSCWKESNQNPSELSMAEGKQREKWSIPPYHVSILALQTLQT